MVINGDKKSSSWGDIFLMKNFFVLYLFFSKCFGVIIRIRIKF